MRDRLVADPRFQQRAAGFVLTRPVARRHARDLFDLVAGFSYSQVLLACVQLRLFEMLAEGPQSLDALAPRLGLTPAAARCLLEAAVGLRLLRRLRSQRYGLGKLGAPMVGNAAIEAMVLHHAALYADLADPVGLLRAAPDERTRTALARYWAYDRADDRADDRDVDRHDARHDAHEPTAGPADAYSKLMAASQSLVAAEILDACDIARYRCLLDVGGGDGSFLVSAAERSPALRLMLFDLPAVGQLARRRLEQAGVSDRASVHAGDFRCDALPCGADIASLVRVIHDHDDAPAMACLRAVHAALPAGGTLVLAEPMADTSGAEAMGAYFGFYLLAMGRGRPRSAADLTQMLNGAGFADVVLRPTRLPLQTQVLMARRAGKPW